MSPGEGFTAAKVENNCVGINKLDGILRFDIGNSLRLSPELNKDHQEKTEKECADQQRVVRGEFEVGVH
jgi:hypothetical protein